MQGHGRGLSNIVEAGMAKAVGEDGVGCEDDGAFSGLHTGGRECVAGMGTAVGPRLQSTVPSPTCKLQSRQGCHRRRTSLYLLLQRSDTIVS